MKKLLIFAFVLAGCSSQNLARIYEREGKEGQYVAKANEDDRAAALNEAAEGAEEFCEKKDKRPLFVETSDETKYTGAMDEKTREAVKKAGEILGGPVKAVITKGTTADAKDYQAELTFKCN